MAKSMQMGLSGKRNELAQGTIFGGESRYGGGRGRYNQAYYDPFARLFPNVGPVRADAPESSWPEEVVTLLSSLDRRTSISASWAAGTQSKI